MATLHVLVFSRSLDYPDQASCYSVYSPSFFRWFDQALETVDEPKCYWEGAKSCAGEEEEKTPTAEPSERQTSLARTSETAGSSALSASLGTGTNSTREKEES